MKKAILLIVILLGFWGCSGGDGPDTILFLGSWRLEGQGKEVTLMSLRNNGSVEIDVRKEGQLSKIIEKIGKATGTWEIGGDGGTLTLNIAEGGESIGWPGGESSYAIVQIDKSLMVLADQESMETRWLKSSHGAAEESDTEVAGPVITLAPLVVSLTPDTDKRSQRYKWLCVAMELHLLPGTPPPERNPQWEEKVILLLSSKTYNDANTLDKFEIIGNEVKKMLNHYLDDTIQAVIFTKTLVTGSQETVDTFRAEFES